MFELLNKTVKYKNDDCPITVFKNMKKSFIKNFFFFVEFLTRNSQVILYRRHKPNGILVYVYLTVSMLKVSFNTFMAGLFANLSQKH